MDGIVKMVSIYAGDVCPGFGEVCQMMGLSLDDEVSLCLVTTESRTSLLATVLSPNSLTDNTPVQPAIQHHFLDLDI